jgi:hypothetical protein
MEKASVFFLWIFVITFLRICIFSVFGNNNNATQIPAICLTGNIQMFIPSDVTYSMYILCFSLAYFFTPMVMLSSQSNTNAINYGVLAFFMAYIALDLFIKKSLSCIQSVFSSLVIGDILSGLFLYLNAEYFFFDLKSEIIKYSCIPPTGSIMMSYFVKINFENIKK